MAFETTLASQLLLPRIGRMRVEDNVLWRRLVDRYMKTRAEEELARKAPEKLWSSEDLLGAVARPVTAALERHKERGESVVMWRDGKIVTLKPEEIDA